MEDFFKELIKTLTIENILSKPEVDSNFKFEKTGWYFFISPLSGILRIKIIKHPNIESTDLTSFLKSRLLIIIGCESFSEFSNLYKFACDNLDVINELQRKSITVVGKNKIHISEPGIYKLKLLANTTSYTNTNPYYLFNGIDSQVFEFYLDNLNSLTDPDHYLNNPFYYFMYDLDGFMIYEEYVDDNLKIGKTYECKVDYISRNSLFSKQLAIKKIYLYLKTDI